MENMREELKEKQAEGNANEIAMLKAALFDEMDAHTRTRKQTHTHI